jgi:hypothetical protein
MHDRMDRRQSMHCRITRGSIPEMDLKDRKKHRAAKWWTEVRVARQTPDMWSERVPSRPGHSGNRQPLWVWGLQEPVGTRTGLDLHEKPSDASVPEARHTRFYEYYLCR